jgi:hypothetical protein
MCRSGRIRAGRPLRDARHARLLGTLQRRLHVRLAWRTEVPLPLRGAQRAWDATISGQGWRYGVEAEMNPSDGQAILCRLQLKQRDGGVDGVILLLPETRQPRLFRREFAPLLAAQLPVPSRRALAALTVGGNPGGSSIVVL